MNRYKRLNSRFLQCGLIVLMLSVGMLPLNSSHAAPTGITLQQASEKAIQQFGGEVIKSEVNKQKGTPVYVIRLLTKGRVKEVLINSQNGKVISPGKE